MKFSLLILTIILFSDFIYSQGFLYKEGESGYGGNLHYGANSSSYGYGSNFNFTINSMISIGASLGIGRSKIPRTSSIAFGPYLNFYPVKYSKSDPITVAFGGGINLYVHNSDLLDSLNLKMIGASAEASIFFLYHIRLDQSWQIIPGVSFGYAYRSLRISDKSYASLEETDNFTNAALSTDIAFRIYDKSLLYLGPSITFGLSGKNNNQIYYSFNVGIAIK